MTDIRDIEDKIRKIFCEALCANYCGRLDIETEVISDCPNDILSYTLKLYLNQPEAPLYFSYQGTEEQFLNYLRKEIGNRQLNKVKYFKGIQTDPGVTDYIILDIYAGKRN